MEFVYVEPLLLSVESVDDLSYVQLRLFFYETSLSFREGRCGQLENFSEIYEEKIVKILWKFCLCFWYF